MSWSKAAFFTVLVLVFLGLLGLAFYNTGGEGLVNLYFHYLTQDIPEKKYTALDFTDRGEGEFVSGYYAGNINHNVWIWTLSGLKRYVSKEGLSVYYYFDVCKIVRDMAKDRVSGIVDSDSNFKLEEPSQLFRLTDWQSRVKVGDYVALKWTRVDGKRVIDKLQGSSNRYYPIEKIGVEQCED